MQYFNINCKNYIVDEKTSEEIYEEYKKMCPQIEDGDYYFGLTLYPRQTIYINKDLTLPQKKKALRHELCHCYLWERGFTCFDSYNEEQVCEIVAACSDMIETLVKSYFENGGKTNE